MKLKLKDVYLRLSGPDGTTEIQLLRAAVPESVMIEKSVEFFGDPEPCMIHRSAVQSRLFSEILSALGESRKNPLPLPGALKRYVCAEGGTDAEVYY